VDLKLPELNTDTIAARYKHGRSFSFFIPFKKVSERDRCVFTRTLQLRSSKQQHSPSDAIQR